MRRYVSRHRPMVILLNPCFWFLRRCHGAKLVRSLSNSSYSLSLRIVLRSFLNVVFDRQRFLGRNESYFPLHFLVVRTSIWRSWEGVHTRTSTKDDPQFTSLWYIHKQAACGSFPWIVFPRRNNASQEYKPGLSAKVGWN